MLALRLGKLGVYNVGTDRLGTLREALEKPDLLCRQHLAREVATGRLNYSDLANACSAGPFLKGAVSLPDLPTALLFRCRSAAPARLEAPVIQ
jgi:hypothetical protein